MSKTPPGVLEVRPVVSVVAGVVTGVVPGVKGALAVFGSPFAPGKIAVVGAFVAPGAPETKLVP